MYAFMSNSSSKPCCWICKCDALVEVRAGIDLQDVGSDDFSITNSGYGMTGDIYECSDCGFLLCPNMTNVLGYYEDMSDDRYEETRQSRAIQERRLVKLARKYSSSHNLLDVGAGSGILVEQAIEMGIDACGIEPSIALQARAQELGIPVHLGVLPNEKVAGKFGIITLVDVLEHVPNPVEFLMEVNANLTDDGIAIVVIPDVGSVVARLLGPKWWHFRVAHIGYFNKKTLALALRTAGFDLVRLLRPTWYFPVSYLLERIQVYLPRPLKFPVTKRFDRLVIPLNFRDSFLVVCRKTSSNADRG